MTHTHSLLLSPPLLVWSCLFIILSDVGHAHIGVEPVHLLSGLAVAETQAKTRRPAHFVDIQNLLDDSLETKSERFYCVYLSINSADITLSTGVFVSIFPVTVVLS